MLRAPPAQTKAQVLDIARNTSARVGGRDIAADDIVLLEDHAYPVCGVPPRQTLEAIRLCAHLGGGPALNGYSYMFPNG